VEEEDRTKFDKLPVAVKINTDLLEWWEDKHSTHYMDPPRCDKFERKDPDEGLIHFQDCVPRPEVDH